MPNVEVSGSGVPESYSTSWIVFHKRFPFDEEELIDMAFQVCQLRAVHLSRHEWPSELVNKDSGLPSGIMAFQTCPPPRLQAFCQNRGNG